MTSAPLFKTPTCTPPKNPSTPLSMIATTTLEEEPSASTPTNSTCRCNDNSTMNLDNPINCNICGRPIQSTMPESAILSLTKSAGEVNAMTLKSMNQSSATPGDPLCK